MLRIKNFGGFHSLLVFDRGSLGPSTVTLMAFIYVATWGGDVWIDIVSVKLFPTKNMQKIFNFLNLQKNNFNNFFNPYTFFYQNFF